VHLEALIVDESFRNHGFGLQLLAAVSAKARADGGAWVAWYARAANRRARRFYRRIGAQEERYLNLYLQDQAFDALADQGRP
jgi:ribosomal protein S18 acetylase RimI-like enzyme